MARNYYPVAQKLTIRIGRFGRGDPEPHCASGSHVKCFNGPWQQRRFDRLHNDIIEDERGASFSPRRRDDHDVGLELVVDDNVQPRDIDDVEYLDDGEVLQADDDDVHDINDVIDPVNHGSRVNAVHDVIDPVNHGSRVNAVHDVVDPVNHGSRVNAVHDVINVASATADESVDNVVNEYDDFAIDDRPGNHRYDRC